MLPVLTAEQMRSVDRLTLEREQVQSIELMERAAVAFTLALLSVHGSTPRPVLVLCGPGNNGGDGLAIARHLARRKWPVRAFCPYDPVRSSSDNAVNLRRLRDLGVEVISGADRSFPTLYFGELVIDALFGTGLDRPLTGYYRNIVHELNGRKATVLAVDLPSGALAEGGPDDRTAVVQAQWTCSFHVPKACLLLPEFSAHCGKRCVVDIGLNPEAIASCNSSHFLLEPHDIQALLPERPRGAHKGRFGHALLLAGSTGHLGAAIMAAGAAVRSGVGLLTVGVPRAAVQTIHAAVPEAMIVELGEAGHLAEPLPMGRWTAIGIGPGIGRERTTAVLLERVLSTWSQPMVFDADALNILAASPDLLEMLPAGSILTPHPGEADRLLGPAADTRERITKASSFARQHQVVVVIKGSDTATCLSDGRVLFNATGNVGMAKGGSGDALTGLITGLLAQGLDPSDAAIAGVWLHGLAGDIAALELGHDGMSAMDLVRAVPLAYQVLRKAGDETQLLQILLPAVSISELANCQYNHAKFQEYLFHFQK